MAGAKKGTSKPAMPMKPAMKPGEHMMSDGTRMHGEMHPTPAKKGKK